MVRSYCKICKTETLHKKVDLDKFVEEMSVAGRFVLGICSFGATEFIYRACSKPGLECERCNARKPQ